VARFTDVHTRGKASDYAATVTWDEGNGQSHVETSTKTFPTPPYPTVRIVKNDDGSFSVMADNLKPYKNIGSFRFECSFYTWIYRIVTNLCLDPLRKRNVRK